VSAPDFAAIIDGEINDYIDWDVPGNAADILAAKVPELCRECEGTGLDYSGNVNHPTECQDCPTIAKLLAIGAAVMSADEANPDSAPSWYVAGEPFMWAAGFDAATSRLRSVQP